ncbi:MAG: rod shape-determining protein MreC [Gammaproteobacteria bacterium]|nr:rod shape-determining protein MreC [Gammaproteobacteria bacterium]
MRQRFEGQMKPLFQRGPSITLRLLILMLLSIAMMTADHRSARLEPLRAGLALLISPLQYLVNLPFAAGAWLGDSFTSRNSLLRDNDRLQEEHLALMAHMQKYEALEVENQRLRELLQSSARVEGRTSVAEIIAVDLDPFKRQIVLNKGTRDGVRAGQPLLDARGILGQVIHAAPYTSSALLITDPTHALPVQVLRNGLRSIAFGGGPSNRLDLPYLANNADIQVGDLLVSSGMGGSFPPDYPVGKVVSVKLDPNEPFAMVSAEPSADMERNREVLLFWSEPGMDASGSAPVSP